MRIRGYVLSCLLLAEVISSASARTPMTSLCGRSPAINAMAVKENEGKVLTAEEQKLREECKRDEAEDMALERKQFPLCLEGAADSAPDCKLIDPAILKHSFSYQANGWNPDIIQYYSIPQKEMEQVGQRRQQLLQKWNGR